MDKKQQQELDEVLAKYHRSKKDVAVSYLKKVRTGAILGIGLDLVFTGGFGTVAAVTAAALPGLKAAFRSVAKRNAVWRDPQQQEIKTGPDVMLTLAQIEAMLGYRFREAIRPLPENPKFGELHKAASSVYDFRAFAAEAGKDIAKLVPAITVTGGGRNGYGTDKYVITVAKITDVMVEGDSGLHHHKRHEYMTLAEGLALADARLAEAEKLMEEQHRQAVEAVKPSSDTAKPSFDTAKPLPPPEPKPRKQRGFNV